MKRKKRRRRLGHVTQVEVDALNESLHEAESWCNRRYKSPKAQNACNGGAATFFWGMKLRGFDK